MKKLTVLLFAVVCLSLSATSVLAVPPLCGSSCQIDYNSPCYCEFTCVVTSCEACFDVFPDASLDLTPSWMAETHVADDAQTAVDSVVAIETTDVEVVEAELAMSDE